MIRHLPAPRRLAGLLAALGIGFATCGAHAEALPAVVDKGCGLLKMKRSLMSRWNAP